MRLEIMSSLALNDGRRISSAQQDGAVVQGRRRRVHHDGQARPGIQQINRQKGDATTQIGSARTTAQGKNVKKKKSITSGTSSTAAKTEGSTNPKRVKELQEVHPVWVRSKNSSTTSIHLRRMNKRPQPEVDDNQASSKPQPPRVATTVANSSPDLLLSTSIPTRHRAPELQARVSYTGRAETSLDRRISMLSHSSGSTKLGEIPQHKWINPWVPPVEVDEESGEEGGPGGNENEDNNRTGMRFWRRFGRNRT
jgi:hypothetical protein